MSRAWILLLFLFASCAFAQERQITYSEKPGISFGEWAAKFPQEKQALGLFRGYQEPVVTYVEDGKRQQKQMPLTMYVTKTQVSINRDATTVNLPSLITIETIRKLDPTISHKVIGPNELMIVTAGRGPVPNFKWCDKDYYNLPDHEEPLSHLKGDHEWCGPRSICVESCYPFKSFLWYGAVDGYNTAKRLVSNNPADLKDYGIAMQAEARYFASESEYGMNLASLTGINTPVRGVMELNIFYLNQVLQYGKIVAVFQEYPGNNKQMVITSLAAIGVRTKSWTGHKGVIAAVLKGRARGINTKTGLTAGVPTFTQDIAKRLADVLEGKN